MGAYSRKYDEILKFLLGHFLKNFKIFDKIGLFNFPNCIFFVECTLLKEKNKNFTVSKNVILNITGLIQIKGRYQKCQKLDEIVEFSKSL